MRAVALLLFALAGCGPSLPSRYVLERDIGPLRYRRYQRVLDVEFPAPDNDAVGHTATYVHRAGEHDVPFVTAFVTVYSRASGLASVVRRQLRTLGSYDLRVVDASGRAFFLDGGEGDAWHVWVSANRVIKIGGAAQSELVRRVVDEYMALYPSDLDEHGRARDGTASAGDEETTESVSEENIEMPRSLSNGEDD